jgi:hypothetical protein
MPAYLTHRVAGERVLDRLPVEVPDEQAFFLGCQGPDMLFFRDFQPWRAPMMSRRIGLRMHHERVRELFKTAFDYARKYDEADREELIAYIAGFITHYAIDKNTHPFVYDKAGRNTGVHNRIEFMWDSFAAKEQWDIEPEQFDIYSDIMYGEVGEGIRGWYRAVVRQVYGRRIGEKAILKAQRHFAKIKARLADINLISRVLIRVIRIISGFDASAMMYPKRRSEEWFSRDEYKSMQDMLQKGIDEACDMIRVAITYIAGEDCSLPEWFGDTDFTGEEA